MLPHPPGKRFFEKTGVPGQGAQIDQTDVIGLYRHNNRTTREGGKEPEGFELFVAKSSCLVVKAHGIAFDPVPDAEVIKKQFTVGEGSRTGIYHPNFFSNSDFFPSLRFSSKFFKIFEKFSFFWTFC